MSEKLVRCMSLLTVGLIVVGCSGSDSSGATYQGTMVCTKYQVTAKYGKRNSLDGGAGATASCTVVLIADNQLATVMSTMPTGSVNFNSGGVTTLGSDWSNRSLNVSGDHEYGTGTIDFTTDAGWRVTATYDDNQISGTLSYSSTYAGTWGNIVTERTYTFTASR